MKNKLKLLIAFTLGTIIFGSIGVYATSKYMSKDISYTKKDGTTISVDNALNDLYTEVNDQKNYTIKVDTGSSSTSYFSQSTEELPNQKFTKIKLISFTKDANVKDCQIYMWSSIKQNFVTMELNKEYLIRSEDDGYKFTAMTVKTWAKSNGTFGTCYVRALLYI